MVAMIKSRDENAVKKGINSFIFWLDGENIKTKDIKFVIREKIPVTIKNLNPLIITFLL
jgi:hypothetical protein|nr:MAG TPA: hypothetical protein [Caudoviricetes sp.]